MPSQRQEILHKAQDCRIQGDKKIEGEPKIKRWIAEKNLLKIMWIPAKR